MLKYILLFLTTPVLLLALNAPTNLVVKATSKTTTTLDWVDNSDKEIGFKIYRDGHLIAFMPKNSTHFEDKNLKPNTTYTYIVYATDYVEPELITDKNIYAIGESIKTNFQYFKDIEWIAIYPMDEPDDNANSASWYHLTDGRTIGSETWGGRDKEGYYEVRAFDKDNTKLASYAFKVEKNPKKRKLIYLGDLGWLPRMAPNLIARHDEIMKLPFDGYIMPGNTFTHYVMSTKILNYETIMDETVGNFPQKIRDITGLYQGKDMFLEIRLKFPGDLWNPDVWSQVTSNFATVAKVAKSIGFKGIAIDDENYTREDAKMINFKFPTKEEVTNNPDEYEPWEISGAKSKKVDDGAYRNSAYTFKEHMEQTIKLYQNIMEAMVAEYPDINVLVFHGPMQSHAKTHDAVHKKHKVLDSNEIYYEFSAAIFTGLKRGLGEGGAKLHDMGEMYRYRTDAQFARSYQWRKYNMAKDINNVSLDENYQWRIPEVDRNTWRDKVSIGHMVVNYLPPIGDYQEYNVRNSTTFGNIKTDISLALSSADEYAIYYCQNQGWLMPGYKDIPYIGSKWENMVREAKQID